MSRRASGLSPVPACSDMAAGTVSFSGVACETKRVSGLRFQTEPVHDLCAIHLVGESEVIDPAEQGFAGQRHRHGGQTPPRWPRPERARLRRVVGSGEEPLWPRKPGAASAYLRRRVAGSLGPLGIGQHLGSGRGVHTVGRVGVDVGGHLIGEFHEARSQGLAHVLGVVMERAEHQGTHSSKNTAARQKASYSCAPSPRGTRPPAMAWPSRTWRPPGSAWTPRTSRGGTWSPTSAPCAWTPTRSPTGCARCRPIAADPEAAAAQPMRRSRRRVRGLR